jgi:hypothetical protein
LRQTTFWALLSLAGVISAKVKMHGFAEGPILLAVPVFYAKTIGILTVP